MAFMMRYLALVVVLSLCGCQAPQPADHQQPPERTVITSENIDKIVGMQWMLQQIRVDGKSYQLTGEMPFIKFDSDGKLAGFGSINRYSSAIALDAQGNLRWLGGLRSTRKAGPPQAMAQEKAYFGGLLRVGRLSVEGIHLYAESPDGRTELVFYVPVE